MSPHILLLATDGCRLRGIMNHLSCLERLMERLQERWMEPLAEWEHRFEDFWTNVLASWVVIAGWGLFAWLWIRLVSPYSFFHFLDHSGLMAHFCIGVLVVALFYFCWKPVAKGRTIGWFIVWLVILGMNAQTPAHMQTASADGQWLVSLCQNLYSTHPFTLSAWYALTAWQTLVLVFRHYKAKQLHYWGLLLGGFTLLIIIYLFSPGMGFLFALAVPNEFFNRWLQSTTENDIHIRGSRMTPSKKARYAYRKRLGADARASAQTFLLGNVDIPVPELTTHLVACGSAGSGKSITLKLIMQACLPLITPDSISRAVVFDPKHNAQGEILGIDGIQGEVLNFNAFQRGSLRYDMAKDFVTLTHAQAFADILIPEPKSAERGDKFFRDAAVNILTGVTLLFIINAPGQWRLADIVRAFGSEKILSALLASDPQTAFYLNSLGSEKTSANILASVCAEIYRYLPIAALWEHAPRSASVREWLNGGQIWLLGEDEEARPAMNALNRLILTRMSQSLLKETDYPEPRTFLFLDELQSIHVEALQEIATKGRSKGICLIAAFQSIQGMYNRYGKEVSDSILGQIRHKAFLKMSDAPTAQWACAQMGDAEVKRQQATSSFSRGVGGLITWSDRTGGSQSIQQTPVVMASEFINIPPVHPPTNQGLTGFYQTSINYKDYIPWDKLQPLLQPAATVDIRPAPPDWQRLEPWTEEDWERLGITEVMYNLNSGSNIPAPPPMPEYPSWLSGD
jgi:type IV secretory pathway TraG/TraD family ATPase VirD4